MSVATVMRHRLVQGDSVETQVRTPQMVFNMPQRLIVPLFQRPYVWNRENQWEPLWQDVTRVADRALANPGGQVTPHFLGAVVLQQTSNAIGLMQERTIIDGQQRLTTLQLLLDALHAVLAEAGAVAPALRLESLVENTEAFCQHPEDRFKVWPTNRDRAPFNAVMGAVHPVDYGAVGFANERMVHAHRFFTEQAREWLLLEGDEAIAARSEAIERTVRELLQVVVIDLTADENAQEIFETLNARGAQLTAADLIKNFVFQRLQESAVDVESIYEHSWKEFETAFWETEINVGRFRYPRSSAFLNHWLSAKTGEIVVASEVFARFKSYCDFESAKAMSDLVREISDAASVYRSFTEEAASSSPTISRLGLFGYRTSALESEVIKPLVLYLLDPTEPAIDGEQIELALDSIESWMVRRMLVRAASKSYSQAVAEMITFVRKNGRAQAGDLIRTYLAEQSVGSRYWPDDNELRIELENQLSYRRLSRGRLRMVLEAIEDNLRGFRNGKAGLGSERVVRGKLHIEHVMPRKWQTHWPLTDGPTQEAEREPLIHNIGNLTLLNGTLNAKVSNAAWLGDNGKRAGLNAHDVFLLNRKLVEAAGDEWTEEKIRARRDALIAMVCEIWPVPAGHVSNFASTTTKRAKVGVDVVDLINAGRLYPGTVLTPKSNKHTQTATVLPDGRIDVNGKVFASPSPAAVAITNRHTNGWRFFYVDAAAKVTLRDVRRDYIESLSDDVDDDLADDED